MKCKICHSESNKVQEGKILNKYKIDYFQCTRCSFVQTENPYWLEESYCDAISVSDTGVMTRNILFSKIATFFLSMFVNRHGAFLDYGGGYGIFTRLMRDNGFDFYWYDKYATNLVARGFEGDMVNKKYEAVTSFENFEHFENPIEEIEKLLRLSDFVLFSTDLVSVPAPRPDEWWYYCLEHGQHVSLFSKNSLEFIAKKYDYHFATNGTNLHIFSKTKISASIFLIEKVLRQLHAERLFAQKSKTNSDMEIMIKKMEK